MLHDFKNTYSAWQLLGNIVKLVMYYPTLHIISKISLHGEMRNKAAKHTSDILSQNIEYIITNFIEVLVCVATRTCIPSPQKYLACPCSVIPWEVPKFRFRNSETCANEYKVQGVQRLIHLSLYSTRLYYEIHVVVPLCYTHRKQTKTNKTKNY